MWGLTSQNYYMIMRDAVVEGYGNFDRLGFFNVHPNLSTRAYNISASIGNAAATAGMRTRDRRWPHDGVRIIRSRSPDAEAQARVHRRLHAIDRGFEKKKKKGAADAQQPKTTFTPYSLACSFEGKLAPSPAATSANLGRNISCQPQVLLSSPETNPRVAFYNTPAARLTGENARSQPGVHCQQQSFRVRPQPVEVIEGRTVELKCEVANQAGAVQWSKDGFVLGWRIRGLQDGCVPITVTGLGEEG
ncbi:hypothetical protein HPB51_014549 [Rhipicephalus microplus]|uniref:Ig-like domain-containing protein n=1 Tax=Rhipicephalus microplus TaxID=6941 RepID=A0A9J6DNP7_RHIMP|nr:hypothetical protein HPB51_014549 [Rhipicephalus microplus]